MLRMRSISMPLTLSLGLSRKLLPSHNTLRYYLLIVLMKREQFRTIPVVPHSSLNRWKALLVAATVIALVSQCYSQTQRPEIKNETFQDGVEHWYLAQPSGGSYFWQKLQEICQVVLLKKTRPFGRSIAFLVGVSKYHNLPKEQQLDKSVPNDIKEMRDLLLRDMAFDEVYIAQDDVVNRDLIERYVKGKIDPASSSDDRLLFYYSGHGADSRGDVGYLLFGADEKGKFYGPSVLSVSTLIGWTQELRFKHMLFILDSCASGLPANEKSVPTDKLMETLSGNGSRTFLTAARANEATYELADREHLGNGVFTAALLSAFRSADIRTRPLVTVAELYASIQTEVAGFRAMTGAETTPSIWELGKGHYKGTFVFLNANAVESKLSTDEAELLGASPLPKGADDSPVSRTSLTGILVVSSTENGNLFIDGRDVGTIRRGGTLTFQNQAIGPHRLEFREFAGTSLVESKEVRVQGGRAALAVFGSQSPVDTSGKIPVGTLVIDATHELGGKVSVDGVDFGVLQPNGRISIPNLIAGPHRLEITREEDQTLAYAVTVSPDQTESFVLDPLVVQPPTSLFATVQ
jgi:hypothetical protein